MCALIKTERWCKYNYWLHLVKNCKQLWKISNSILCNKTNLFNCRTDHIGVRSAVCKSCWSRGCKHGGWGVSPVFPSTVPTPTHHTCFLYLKSSPHRCQVAQKLNKMFLTNTTPICSAQWEEILATLVWPYDTALAWHVLTGRSSDCDSAWNECVLEDLVKFTMSSVKGSVAVAISCLCTDVWRHSQQSKMTE